MQGARLSIRRRSFMAALLGGAATTFTFSVAGAAASKALSGAVQIPMIQTGEDLFAYMTRTRGGFDPLLYRQLLGAANSFKEGDLRLGVAAADETARRNARTLLANTRIGALQSHPVLHDSLTEVLRQDVDSGIAAQLAGWTLAQLRSYLVQSDEAGIARALPGLGSETIGCVVKLMSNAELTRVSAKIFHPLPGSQVGAKGYLGARLQPTSKTDHPDDILWQVLDGWSHAVGDVVIGANPVSSHPEVVARLELALHDLRTTFGLQDTLPHSVLAPIDVQAQVEKMHPGVTGIWFQNIAGSDAANVPFDVTVSKLLRHAKTRTGRWGLYFETGQGSELLSGAQDGCDLVLHEARRHGFARLLRKSVAQARGVSPSQVWLHVNNVAGVIGPQVLRTRHQLVRACLEDLVMGKLHGLTMGLDVCAAATMELDSAQLDWCLDELAPANPAYLVGLPKKHDPLVGYYSTAFADHLRLRKKFGFKVSDAMSRFFQQVGVLDASGNPTAKFGDPTWLYLQYRRRKGDQRSDGKILAQARRSLRAARERGANLAA